MSGVHVSSFFLEYEMMFLEMRNFRGWHGSKFGSIMINEAQKIMNIILLLVLVLGFQYEGFWLSDQIRYNRLYFH